MQKTFTIINYRNHITPSYYITHFILRNKDSSNDSQFHINSRISKIEKKVVNLCTCLDVIIALISRYVNILCANSTVVCERIL